MRIWVNKIGRVEEQLVHHDGDQIRIGRDAHNDIVLDSPFVAQQAAVLRRSGTRWELIPLGNNEVRVGNVAVQRGERVLIPVGETISIYPFQVSLERPAVAAGEGDRRARLDQQMSELILRIHQELLRRIDVDSGDDDRRDNEEFLIKLELDLEEIARLEGLETPEKSELLVHLAAKTIESLLIGQLVESVEEHNSVWEHGQRWPKLHTANRVIETELQSLVRQMAKRLELDEISDLSGKIGRAEERFWQDWEEIADDVYGEVARYAALRYVKKQIKDIVFGYGPLEDLLRMPNISEIMVVDSERLYIEKNGVLEKSGRRFVSDAVTISIIERIVSRVGRRIDRSQPLVDARLMDGSRVNAVIDPIAISGPCLTIRKFPAKKLRVDDLIAKGSLSPTAAEFLRAAVVAGKNILISGGTGTGKTTLLNCLSDFIPDKERIVTVEDTAELQLHKDHVVRMETKSANVEGAGAYEIRDLVKNALRMRPDRIVVGECRGAEALDMLQAMNTGHDGSMTTIHANTSRDCILRLEVLVQTAADLPIESIHRQIASAIDLVVQLTRLRNGARCVTQITEFVEYDDTEHRIVTKDIFFRDPHRENGSLLPTGSVPTFMSELLDNGLIELDTFLL
ncbi:MAG: ATPase, T2SS/T4P/T4SS family [Pirellulales bacterium]